MPRKKLRLNDPSNIDEVTTYIEEHACRSSSKELPQLVHQLPSPVRGPRLRIEGGNISFNITNHAHKVAAAIHLRGKVAQSPCNSCHGGNGPFMDCIVLPGYDTLTKMCCSNCQWTLRTTHRSNVCEFAEGRNALQEVLYMLMFTSLGRPTRERAITQKRVITQKPILPQKGERESKLPSQQITNSSDRAVFQEATSTHILGQLFLPPL
jgi:hypothetical protein